jgi:hypothetical protein
MCALHRYDLDVISCVNKEVEVFNKKLSKQMKIFDNATLVKVHPDTDLFTKHGLHMNKKGKEQAAKKIMATINYILNKKKKEPISTTWKEESRVIGKQENHFWQEQQNQGSEGEENISSKDGRLEDIQEDSEF